MIHPVHEKWAKLLVHYCCTVQEGENVAIHIDSLAEPMARALYREVLRAGANPVLRMSYPEVLEDTLELASDKFLESEATLELTEIKHIQSWIRVRAPHNTKSLDNLDKTKYSKLLKKARPVSNIRVNDTKWCLSNYPTHAGAQDAGMSLDDYENFVYGAMFLFDDDPVKKWQEVHKFQERVIKHLKKADEIHIKADGTDLKLSVKGRVWENSAGHKNMPSGEVFTGPLESSANGMITFSIPSSVNGAEVEKIRLVFKDGQVAEASAEKGNDMLQAQLNTDKGARYLGELGIGTNYNIQKPTKQILFDEKIGGTIHLALGQSYQSTGGVNESAIHWDMICDLRQGGELYIDGELFQQNGQFKL
jgi:aminopeptidase